MKIDHRRATIPANAYRAGIGAAAGRRQVRHGRFLDLPIRSIIASIDGQNAYRRSLSRYTWRIQPAPVRCAPELATRRNRLQLPHWTFLRLWASSFTAMLASMPKAPRAIRKTSSILSSPQFTYATMPNCFAKAGGTTARSHRWPAIETSWRLPQSLRLWWKSMRSCSHVRWRRGPAQSGNSGARLR